MPEGAEVAEAAKVTEVAKVREAVQQKCPIVAERLKIQTPRDKGSFHGKCVHVLR